MQVLKFGGSSLADAANMLKAADKHMTMTDIHLVEKHGGRSGDFSYQQVTP